MPKLQTVLLLRVTICSIVQLTAWLGVLRLALGYFIPPPSASSMTASVIKNTRWKRRSSDDGFVISHQGVDGHSSVLRLSKMRIKWYQKAILSGLVALVFNSNGWLTLVSLDTFFAS